MHIYSPPKYIYVKIINFISFDKTKAYWKYMNENNKQEFMAVIRDLYVALDLLKNFPITDRMFIVSTRFEFSGNFIRKIRSHRITLIFYISEDRSHTDKYRSYRRLWTLSVSSVCEKPNYRVRDAMIGLFIWTKRVLN